MVSLVYFFALGIIPIITAASLCYLYRLKHYPIIVNKTGRADPPHALANSNSAVIPKVLIATLEYEIPDWNIRVRIGGLGVIAALMGRTIPNNLIWVVPKVGDVDYPPQEPGFYIPVTIFGQIFSVAVSTHQLSNVTYYLLDCPLFKEQSSKKPYPDKMDDVRSAMFYSCWNQAIAHILISQSVEVYHINDFHGGIAQLYLLSLGITIPCVLSLHNAEFQGQWMIRSGEEKRLICSIFNINISICEKYIQLGHAFNLLHGASTFISIHQGGQGSGGVSVPYGERCKKRYAALWCLGKMENLENPNPADTECTTDVNLTTTATDRIEAKIATQKWAGLKIDKEAIILVFVGRFSHQKGIDLIADLAPSILSKYKIVQLICIGPVIDVYGKLAAIKLLHLVSKFPNRVCCRPQFTVIPRFLYQCCDFVLLPSRDEPFGLGMIIF